MEVQDSGLGKIRGRMGNMIYYVRNGKQYMRRVAIPGKRRKWETEGRTDKQKAVTGRFAVVQAFYAKYCEQVSVVIWRTAARKKKRTGPNVFNSLNCKCFSGDGCIVDFENFLFSDGELLLPRKMQVTREDHSFRVSWEEEREWRTASPDDRLWVGVLYDAHPMAPCLALEVKGVRGDFCGEFRLDPTWGEAAYVYCFFGRTDESAFSASCCFRIS